MNGATDREEVVITGVGAVTALGEDAETTWANLLAGADGTGPLSRFGPEPGYRVQRACQVGELWDRPGPDSERSSERTLKQRIAVAAALEAMRSARLSGFDPDRTGVLLGTLGSDLLPFEERVRGGGSSEIDTGAAKDLMPAGVAAQVAERLGCHGWVAAVLTACSAGNQAMSMARQWILGGHADVMFVGGADVVTQTQYTHFHNVRSLTPDVCRPFDRRRRGLVIGEGAGFLVLEASSHARRRGGQVLSRFLGAGASADAFHMTAPDPSGKGPERAMRMALREARRAPEEVDYVCAHGTGTPLNDRVEAQVLRRLFGGGAPASSIKSAIGHCMGAASVIGAIVSVLALRDQVVPPTIHFEDPDPECPIDCVPNVARSMPLRTVLNNALAFGGNNCAVVLGAGDA